LRAGTSVAACADRVGLSFEAETANDLRRSDLCFGTYIRGFEVTPVVKIHDFCGLPFL
jgi:hypothetical protein